MRDYSDTSILSSSSSVFCLLSFVPCLVHLGSGMSIETQWSGVRVVSCKELRRDWREVAPKHDVRSNGTLPQSQPYSKCAVALVRARLFQYLSGVSSEACFGRDPVAE
jgi:hypothetical protein